MRIELWLSWFYNYNYKSFALCNFPISRILLMRTRCSSATSVTGVITSTALDSKRSPAVDRHSLLYNILLIPMHILKRLFWPGRWHCSECSYCQSCGCKTPLGDGSVVLDRWAQDKLLANLSLYLYPGQVDTRQFVHKFISLCFSRDEKAEWVYETKTNMKGEKIYSHTMCLPCHK